MEVNQLVSKREFIYHLTSSDNLDLIIEEGNIFSTNYLVENSDLNKEEKEALLFGRRPDHVFVNSRGNKVMIRDQRPISIKALNKCLTHDLSTSEFINHLNDRVFFWPTLKRLNIHYQRYHGEKPLIIRVATKEMLGLNLDTLRLCRLNSGATRCSSHHNGAPPPRGLETFKKIEEYELNISSIAEVTFLGHCQLPERVWVGEHPNGPWVEKVI